jgi:hypothetical protein
MGEQAKTKMKGWTSEVHAARQLELFEERGWIQKAGPAQSTAN